MAGLPLREHPLCAPQAPQAPQARNRAVALDAEEKAKLFIDSILAFSFFPIRAISALGLVAVVYGLYIIGLKLVSPNEPEGWTTLMVVVLFVSAFQIVALGVIGEYVWRGLDAARKRPLYVVNEVYE